MSASILAIMAAAGFVILSYALLRRDRLLRRQREAETKQLKEISAILQGSRTVMELRDFKYTSRAIFDSCKDLIGATAGYVALLSKDGNENEVLFLDAGGLPCTVDPSLPMPIRGLRGEAYRMRKVVYENDFSNSKWMDYMPQGHVSLSNVLFAPLIINEKAVGLVGLANKREGFNENDARLALEFGNLVSFALYNSRTLDLLKESEERYRRQTQEISAVNKELEAFTYSVSHDLGAPLTTIKGFARALLDSYVDRLDEHGKDYLNRLSAASRKMSELIDDLLSLSRITRSEIHRKKVDLSSIVQVIIGELKRTQPDRKVDFIISPEVTAQGDERLLGIVIDNLLRNAWKFTGKHSEAMIEFGVMQRNGEAVYFVKDDGAGFDKKYADKLFKPFQRLHTTAEFPGTGIGLATVQRIINKHGGNIWADGEVEKGATFYFTL